MYRCAARFILALAIAASPAAWASSPASTNYALPASVLNGGVDNMASAGFQLSSSLGDPLFSPLLVSTGYRLEPGFRAIVRELSTGCLLDIDGNGSVDALTDGLMIVRTLFGLTGTSVTAGAVGAGAKRTTWAQIQPMIHMRALDIDGNGATDALTDGLLLIRALFGFTGASVTNGAIGTGAIRADWTAVRGYLNASCGASFAP